MHPTLSLAAGTIILSLAPIFVRASPVGPTATGAYRCLLAVPILAAILMLQKKPLFAQGAGLRYWLGTLGAGCCFAVDLSLWHRSIQYAGPGLATVLANTQVFFLAAIGVLAFGDRADRRFWAALMGAFSGMVLLVWREDHALTTAWKDITLGGDRYWIGVGLGLCAAFAYACFILCLRSAGGQSRGGSTAQRLFTVSLVSGSLMALAAGIEGDLGWPGIDRLGPLLGLAILPQVFGWLVITGTLPKVRVSVAGLVMLLQPMLSVLLSRWLFDEMFSGPQFAGAALTLASVYLGSTRQARS